MGHINNKTMSNAKQYTTSIIVHVVSKVTQNAEERARCVLTFRLLLFKWFSASDINLHECVVAYQEDMTT